jgi:hypothetical protein
MLRRIAVAALTAATLALTAAPSSAHTIYWGSVSTPDTCQWALRGGNGDDDIHAWGVAHGARSFAGWKGQGRFDGHRIIQEAEFVMTPYVRQRDWFYCYFPFSTVTIYDRVY